MSVTPALRASREEEQQYFDYALDTRERKRQTRQGVMVAKSTGYLGAAALGAPGSDVAFRRIDTGDGDCFYIGKSLIMDDTSSEILVYAWQTPMVMELSEATALEPKDVVVRRSFTTGPPNKITGIDDQIFADIAAQIEALDDPDLALIEADLMLTAALERERSPEMKEIIQTIQAAQSRLIRHPHDSLLIVQGGPGTGKTAVALHRVSFLLFNHSDEFSPEDILIVGPNATFTKYINRVLPELGDEHVPQTDLQRMMRAEVLPNVKEPEEVARLKGDDRMVPVLAQGLVDRVRAPSEATVLSVKNVAWRVTLEPSEIDEIIRALRGETYSQGRAAFRKEVMSHAATHIRRTLKDSRRFAGDPKSLLSVLEIDRLVERCWPQLSPQAFLRDLYGSAERLLSAAGSELLGAEVQLLRRPAETRLTDQPWSKEDLALLDFVTVEMNGVGETYRHIVVDEAQDLSPMQLVALRNRSTNGQMTLVGDIAQSTGRWARDSWKDVLAALQTSRSQGVEELNFGYRVPKSVMDIAALLLPEVAPGISAPRVIRDVDDKPRFAVAETQAEMIDAAITAVQEQAARGRFTGVVCPDGLKDVLEGALGRHDMAFTSADKGALGSAINVLSPVAAKGLEFDAVVVVDPAMIVDAGPEGLRMLYIALTRTTRSLDVVFMRGSLPTALLGAPGVPAEAHGLIEGAASVAAADSGDGEVGPGAAITPPPATGLEVPRHAAPVSPRTPNLALKDLSQSQVRTVKFQAGELMAVLEGAVPRPLWRAALLEALAEVEGTADEEATAER